MILQNFCFFRYDETFVTASNEKKMIVQVLLFPLNVSVFLKLLFREGDCK